MPDRRARPLVATISFGSVEDVAASLGVAEAPAKKRGPIKKRA